MTACGTRMGLIGTGAPPAEGMHDPLLTDAGGKPVGTLRVDASGLRANWMIPGKMVPGRCGAMDLVTGAKRVIAAMPSRSWR